eukprot:7291235-Prymnesium_polylepis.1
MCLRVAGAPQEARCGGQPASIASSSDPRAIKSSSSCSADSNSSVFAPSSPIACSRCRHSCLALRPTAPDRVRPGNGGYGTVRKH